MSTMTNEEFNTRRWNAAQRKADKRWAEERVVEAIRAEDNFQTATVVEKKIIQSPAFTAIELVWVLSIASTVLGFLVLGVAAGMESYGGMASGLGIISSSLVSVAIFGSLRRIEDYLLAIANK